MNDDSLLAQMRAKAAVRVEQLRSEIDHWLTLLDPLEALCELSLTHLMHSSDEFPDTEEAGRWQAIIEFLAWLILARDPETKPVSERIDPDARIALSKCLTEFHALFGVSLLKGSPDDATASLRTSLQQEAIYVRGEGLPEQIEALAVGLYGPHDAWFNEHLGFTISEAFSYSGALAGSIANRFNAALEKGRARMSDLEARCRLVQQGNLEQLSPEDGALRAAIDKIGVEAVVSADWWLSVFERSSEILGVTADDLAASLGLPSATPSLRSFLNRLSQPLGGQRNTQPELLGLNPLVKQPIISLGGRYFLASLPTLYDALLSTFHFDLLADASYKATYDDARGKWLESEAATALRRLFPLVYSNLTFGRPGQIRSEVDCLVPRQQSNHRPM